MSSSSDNSLAVWDLRKLSDSGKIKSVASGVHSKTCQSAYFAPDGTFADPSLVHAAISLGLCSFLSLLSTVVSIKR